MDTQEVKQMELTEDLTGSTELLVTITLPYSIWMDIRQALDMSDDLDAKNWEAVIRRACVDAIIQATP